MGVGLSFREALEKALVDRVEEGLLLREVIDRPRCVLDRQVERIEPAQEKAK